MMRPDGSIYIYKTFLNDFFAHDFKFGVMDMVDLSAEVQLMLEAQNNE